MGRLVTMKLSDGRLQLWVCRDYYLDPITGISRPTFLSSWQAALDPSQPWNSLSPFSVYPPTDPILAVAAGNFPDGSGQLWAQALNSQGSNLLTITKDPNDQWGSWVPFLDQPQMAVPVIGQMAGGGLQIWCVDTDFTIRTAWSQTNSSGWTGWTQVNPSNPPGIPLATWTFTPTGLQQLWARTSGYGSPEVCISTWQTTTDPSAPWNPWQIPFVTASGPLQLPPPDLPIYLDVQSFAAAQSANIVQLFGLRNGALQTTTSTMNSAPSGGWTAWSSIAAPGFMEDITVAQPWSNLLPQSFGPLQLWAIVAPNFGPSQILTSQQASFSSQFGPFEQPGWLMWP
jgi:hypothetical protein